MTRAKAMAVAELLAAALARWPCVVCGYCGGHTADCPYGGKR